MSLPPVSQERQNILRSLCLHNSTVDKAFSRLIRVADHLLNARSLVAVNDGKHQVIKYLDRLSESWSTTLGKSLFLSLCEHVATTGKPVIVEDAKAELMMSEHAVFEILGIGSYTCSPIITTDGCILGTLLVTKLEPHKWRDQELSILADLIESVVTEIELRTELNDLRKSKSKLEGSEQRYRILSELMSDYAFSGHFTMNGEVENDWITKAAFERVTGYSISEIVAQANIPTLLREYLAKTKADVLGVKSGNTTINQYRIRTKQGELRWLQVNHYPRWNEPKDRVVGFYGIVHDVTESKLAEQRELQLRAEEERSRVLRQCINIISHDFRTPLSILGTNIYLLKHSKATNNQDRLEVMERQIFRLTKIMDNILIVARLEDFTQWSFQSVDYIGLIKDTCRQINTKAHEQEVELLWQSIDDNIPLYISADSSHLHLAIKHLIENAIQFTPAGGQIIVRVLYNQSEAILEVEDTGVGIHENNLPHVFERFFRTDNARSNDGGGGMGLAIVKQVINAHAGSIEVESIVEKGTTFRLRLPMLKDEKVT